MNRFFVTGTDTGIGKTVVSTVLARGLGARYWKPIQTGAVEGTDSEFARRWLGADRVARECYVFDEPVSPHLAARANETEIDLSVILESFRVLSSSLVVEGAGGVLVPFNAGHTMIDLMKHLGLPVILASSTRLGTINHTLLTLEAFERRAIEVTGVVMTGEEKDSPWRTIESYGGVKVLGHVPRVERFTDTFFREAFRNLSLPQEEEVSCALH